MPIQPMYYDDQTIYKVFNALMDSGLTHEQAQAGVLSMQNAGLYFREMPRADYDAPIEAMRTYYKK